ncbi:MAG: S-layer homology domain-containing protein [Candidatus Ancillula sp.]|nr:S-layer homology domain-containing protein [Candidatus Ancillula sp.]
MKFKTQINVFLVLSLILVFCFVSFLVSFSSILGVKRAVALENKSVFEQQSSEKKLTESLVGEKGSKYQYKTTIDLKNSSLIAIIWGRNSKAIVSAEYKIAGKSLKSLEINDSGEGPKEANVDSSEYGLFQKGDKITFTINSSKKLNSVRLTIENTESSQKILSYNPSYNPSYNKVESSSDSQISTSTPKIHTRADWGANENLMHWKRDYTRYQGAIIHHTAGDNYNYSKASVPGLLRAIYHYHAVTLGWGDIGYNFLIDRFGQIWEGRKGSIDSQVVGGHAYHANYQTFGVSVIGDYQSNSFVAPAIIKSLKQIITWKFNQSGIVGSGKMHTYNGYGYSVSLPKVVGHRDQGLTSCPGRYLENYVPEIRDYVIKHTIKHSVSGSLLKKWQKLGGVNGKLGAPIANEKCQWGVDNEGCAQNFKEGQLAWSRQTGAHPVYSQINKFWQNGGGRDSDLGYPTADQKSYKVSGGKDGFSQVFQGGKLYWTPKKGVWIKYTGWSGSSINWMLSKKISVNNKDNFLKYKTASREEIVTFLERYAKRIEDKEVENIQSCGFEDMTSDKSFNEAICWAKDNHITTGFTSKKFSPLKKTTRLQIALFIYRLAGSPQVNLTKQQNKMYIKFKDTKKLSKKDQDAVKFLISKKVTTGVTTTTFKPQSLVTREQLAAFLYRMNQAKL